MLDGQSLASDCMSLNPNITRKDHDWSQQMFLVSDS